MRKKYFVSVAFSLWLCCGLAVAQDTNQSVFLKESLRVKESIR
jgi:hypothetical protein